jgi:hypothetical protein
MSSSSLRLDASKNSPLLQGCQEWVRAPLKKKIGHPRKGVPAKNPYTLSEGLPVAE